MTVDIECDVKVKAPVKVTEDPKKVMESVLNILPELKVEVSEDHIKGRGNIKVLTKLRESLENRKIRSTARKILSENRRGPSTTFYLNKQTAFIGKVNILEEEISPLGDIRVEITSKTLKEVIDWLAPKIEG